MATATPVFSSPITLTMTLASLASDTALVAGRASTAVDQKDTTDAIDVLVGGKVMTGTSPTAARQIEVWLYGTYDDVTFSGGATGTDANLTPSEKTLMKLLQIIPTVNTSNKAYQWGPFSVAQAFGGVIPAQWGVYMVHNTGVVLHATGGNHEVKAHPIKMESA